MSSFSVFDCSVIDQSKPPFDDGDDDDDGENAAHVELEFAHSQNLDDEVMDVIHSPRRQSNYPSQVEPSLIFSLDEDFNVSEADESKNGTDLPSFPLSEDFQPRIPRKR